MDTSIEYSRIQYNRQLQFVRWNIQSQFWDEIRYSPDFQHYALKRRKWKKTRKCKRTKKVLYIKIEVNQVHTLKRVSFAVLCTIMVWQWGWKNFSTGFLLDNTLFWHNIARHLGYSWQNSKPAAGSRTVSRWWLRNHAKKGTPCRSSFPGRHAVWLRMASTEDSF